jgi:hypothetical protein
MYFKFMKLRLHCSYAELGLGGEPSFQEQMVRCQVFQDVQAIRQSFEPESLVCSFNDLIDWKSAEEKRSKRMHIRLYARRTLGP